MRNKIIKQNQTFMLMMTNSQPNSHLIFSYPQRDKAL